MPAYTHDIEPEYANYEVCISHSDQVGILAAHGEYHGRLQMYRSGYDGPTEELIVRIFHGPPALGGSTWHVLGGSVNGVEVKQVCVLLCTHLDDAGLGFWPRRGDTIAWTKVR